MRFLLNVIDSVSNSGTSDEIAAIDAFNDQLMSDGHWVIAVGIKAPENSVLIDNRHGAGISNPGSLYTQDEFHSGFWVIEAESQEKALELATAGSQACNRRVEVRPLF